MEKKKIDEIELRSENIRNIIGAVPPSLIRCGITIVVLFFVLVVVATYYIPYPNNLKVQAHVVEHNKQIYISALVPYKHLNEIYPSMDIQIEFEGYPSNNFGFVGSKVTSINKDVITINNKNYFMIKALVPDATKYDIKQNMKGIAYILISNESILKRIISI